MNKKKKKKQLHFWCPTCHFYWKTDDYTVNPHPMEKKYNHISTCPECGVKTEEVPHYFANLEKMHANATGPVSAEGKRISSMNNFKTGMYSKKANRLAPALYGKYPQCKNCEYAEMCKVGNMINCPYYLGPMLRFIAAYQEGRVEDLKEFAGLQQGRTQMIIEMMTDALFDKGVLLEEIDKNGVVAYKANPLIKQYPAIMETAGYTSNQNKMNSQTADEIPKTPDGHLEKEDGMDYIARLSVAMAKAVKEIPKAEDSRKKDKIASSEEDDLSKMELDVDENEENPF